MVQKFNTFLHYRRFFVFQRTIFDSHATPAVRRAIIIIWIRVERLGNSLHPSKQKIKHFIKWLNTLPLSKFNDLDLRDNVNCLLIGTLYLGRIIKASSTHSIKLICSSLEVGVALVKIPFWTISVSCWLRDFGRGLVVSVLAFDSGDPNSNPTVFWRKVVWKEQKRGWVVPLKHLITP